LILAEAPKAKHKTDSDSADQKKDMPAAHATGSKASPLTVDPKTPKKVMPIPPAPGILETLKVKNASGPPAAPFHQMSSSQVWDTTKVPDGSYQLKIVASDAPSNGADALTAEAILGGLTVDNAAPKVTINAQKTFNEKKQLALSGTAENKLTVIVAVQYKIDDQSDWISASPSDGIFDSAKEGFNILTDPLPTGSHKVTVQAITDSGKSSDTTVTVTSP
jgi:hypothetical protein